MMSVPSSRALVTDRMYPRAPAIGDQLTFEEPDGCALIRGERAGKKSLAAATVNLMSGV